MADLSALGTITLDRIARGFKVTVELHRPGSNRPERIGPPEHFRSYGAARLFAEHLQSNTGWTLTDNAELRA